MSAPNSAAAKTERLMNLVMTLLYTRRPLPKARIREIVEQYRLAHNTEAFERMFERDKEDLRELGIPLVTEDITAAWEDEPGYRIHERDYALPDLHFEPDELAVLGLAARAWSHATLAAPAATALRKLRAGGVEPDGDAFIGVEPLVATREPAFAPLLDALLTLTPVCFEYARPGHDAPATRRVHPWGLATASGRWYLTGHDLDRDAPRVFRLSRIAGAVRTVGASGSYAVPPHHNPAAMVGRRREADTAYVALVRVRPGTGHALRARSDIVDDAPDWTTLRLPYADRSATASELASYADDVIVDLPDDLRAAVIANLAGAAAGSAREGAA